MKNSKANKKNQEMKTAKFNPMIRIKELGNPLHYKFEEVSCYLCGSADSKEYLIGEEDLTGKDGAFLYVQCEACNLVYQNPRLNLDSIKEFYDQEYIAHRKKTDFGILTPVYEWTMNKHDRDKEKLVRKFIKLDASKKLLDVGCAVGTFLLHMKKKTQCKIVGVDFKDGSHYPGFDQIDFKEGLFYEQNLAEEDYDLITMWHFFEHDYDPNKTLETAHRVLKKEGKLVIEVPRLDSVTFRWFGNKWPGVQSPQHTALYDKRSFVAMLEKHGFVVESYLPYGAFPPFFYIFTGFYFRFIGKGLNLDRIVIPYFFTQLFWLPVIWLQKYLNLSMQTAVCRKKLSTE